MSAIVESSHLFKSLDVDGRTDALESGYVQSFSAGEVLMRQGMTGTVMFLIFKGTVNVETDTPGGTCLLYTSPSPRD